MNTMAHLPHPAGQNLLGEWTSPMCSPHSRGASHSLTLQNAPSGSTVTLGKWGSKTVPVGNRLRAATPYRTAQAVSNALQGNTTGRPRPCPTRCKETPPDGPGRVQRAARKHHHRALLGPGEWGLSPGHPSRPPLVEKRVCTDSTRLLPGLNGQRKWFWRQNRSSHFLKHSHLP